MRTLLKLLSLLLCFELIVSPIQPGLSLIGTNAFAQQSCPTGFEYDSILNRCLTKAETANVMNATMNCGGDVECYKQNAQKAFQDKVNAGEAPERKDGGGFISTVATAAAVAGPVTMLVYGMSNSKSQCKSPSFYAMIGGALALLAGDTMANMGHKKRLKEIKEEWGKIVNPEQANGDKDKERETSIEAQSQAFEMLARAEDSLAKAAKMKKTFFMIATLAYGVSAAISVMEIIKEKSLKAAAAAPGAGAAAAAALAQHKVQHTCTEMAASTSQEKESLYAYYTEGKELDLKHEIQSLYNLKNSNDMASLIMNQRELEKGASSLTDFEELKVAFKDTEPKDPTAFEAFKGAIVAFASNLSPISNAMADEAAAQPTTDESNNSATAAAPAATASKGVDTNAAKAFKEDKAKGINFMAIGIGAVAGAVAGKMIKGKLLTSMNRLIFSGVMAGMTLMMAKHAGSQAEASTKRAELLRKMRDEFLSASGAVYACKSEDRNDPSKPNCYCYTAENQRNANRGSSQVCQQLWSGKNMNAGSYTASNSQSDRICVTAARQADPTCKCKTSNTCMKVGLSGLKGINAGTMSMLGNGLAPVNGVTTGSIDAASVDSASLANQAAKMQKLTDDMLKDTKLKDVAKQKAKGEIALKKELAKAGAGMSGNNLLGSTSNSGMPTNPGEAARMLEKEIEPNIPTSIGGADTIAAPTNEVSNEALEFGLTQEDLAAQEGQIAEVMKEDLDYGGNDINQGSKTNIFDVLSNRYQRSGMKRLFDEKDSSPAEAAAKTDINQ